LGLNQEYIELDLFHYGLAKFSVQEFAEAGLNEEDMFLIEFMADQEEGHAIALSHLLGRRTILLLLLDPPTHPVARNSQGL
jgi:Ferritin-like domain